MSERAKVRESERAKERETRSSGEEEPSWREEVPLKRCGNTKVSPAFSRDPRTVPPSSPTGGVPCGYAAALNSDFTARLKRGGREGGGVGECVVPARHAIAYDMAY